MSKINYVLGFCFDAAMDNVLLIEKKKPDWQKGLLNGLGGKQEKGETPLGAMIREFKEECGLRVTDWVSVCSMAGSDWTVDVFYSREKDNGKFDSAKSMEEEILKRIEVTRLIEERCVSNLHWLIPLCIDHCMYENSDYLTVIQF